MTARRIAVIAALAFCVAACSGGNDSPTPVEPVDVFPLPGRIAVSVAPFRSIDDASRAREAVDWQNDPSSAAAVTAAHAATEIQGHLALVGIRMTIDASQSQSSSTLPSIILALRGEPLPQRLDAAAAGVDYSALGDQGYAVVARGGDVLITANHRTGLLYGAYAFLEQLGFAWPDPYETLTPTAASLRGALRWASVSAVPRIGLRGFWAYAEPTVPDEFAVWLARNRLNLGGRVRLPLQRLLSLQGWGGQHELLQQEFSRPGLFEAHPDWFALINGVRRPVTMDTPLVYFNPAFCNAAAADYFASRLVERLESGDLQGIDVVNVWPADDRFDMFDQSDEARALGNATDNMLYFYGNVARRLREAHAAGRLSRRVTLAGFAYFQTALPPTNRAVVEPLEAADNYLHVFSPIERDWAGPFSRDAVNRETNRRIFGEFDGWHAFAGLRYGMMDYQNLSLYGGLVVGDLLAFESNFAELTRGRSALYAYMHPLKTNPGPRRLTNRLLARLAWSERRGDLAVDPAVMAEEVTREYYAQRYGALAAQWRAIDALMAQSVENAKEMFGSDSLSWLVLQEQIWQPAFYAPDEVTSLVDRFRSGGVQDLPAAYSGRVTIRASFRGLDESIAMQAEAARRWDEVLAQPAPADVRRRLQDDVIWYQTTASRYRLLAATTQYVIARNSGIDVQEHRQAMARELEFLRRSPVLSDTISPVNQRLFLDLHARLAGL